MLAVFKTGLFIQESVAIGDVTDNGDDTDEGVGLTDNGDVTDNGDMGSGEPTDIPVVTERAVFLCDVWETSTEKSGFTEVVTGGTFTDFSSSFASSVGNKIQLFRNYDIVLDKYRLRYFS